jgi:hypothetical protein
MLKHYLPLAILFATIVPALATPIMPKTDLPLDLQPPAQELKIESAEFGIIHDDHQFEETTKVPYVIDQAYGWRMEVTPPDAVVHWKEEFILPNAPKTWGDKSAEATQTSNARDVQNGGKMCVTEKDVRARDGLIGNFWSVAKGDPHGKYELRVSVEGKFVKSFLFELGRTPSAKPHAKK